AVAICLAPGKQQRHCKAMPTRRRRSHSRTRITLLDDPELLGLTEPPTPARIHDLEPFDTASICKDIHTDSLLSDRPVKPRRSLAEAYDRIAGFQKPASRPSRTARIVTASPSTRYRTT